MKKISVLIVDAHRLIRETLSFIMKSDERFDVAAACGDSEKAIELAQELNPNIILMDINIGPENGFETTRKILALNKLSRIIGVSIHSNPIYAKRILQAGAKGYVTKNCSIAEILEAIQIVMKGDKYLCKEIKTLISEKVLFGVASIPKIDFLTNRELQIVNYICGGHSSQQIGFYLQISRRTVDVHRQNILKKLKIKRTSALLNFIKH